MTSNDGLNEDSTIQAVGDMMKMPASTSCAVFSLRIMDSLSGVLFIPITTRPRRAGG